MGKFSKRYGSVEDRRKEKESSSISRRCFRRWITYFQNDRYIIDRTILQINVVYEQDKVVYRVQSMNIVHR